MNEFLLQFLAIQAEQNEILEELPAVTMADAAMVKSKFAQNQAALQELITKVGVFWCADVRGTHDRA